MFEWRRNKFIEQIVVWCFLYSADLMIKMDCKLTGSGWRRVS